MSSQPPDSSPNAPCVAAALDVLSKVQNSALTFSMRKFLAFSAPKAVLLLLTIARKCKLNHKWRQILYNPIHMPPITDLAVTHQTRQLLLNHSVPLHQIPRTHILLKPKPCLPLPCSTRDLPVVCVFGGGTHAEGADAASMSPSTSPVPASTIDIHPPETQVPTPPSNTLLASPSLDGSAPATTPCTPCDLPVVHVFGGGTRAEGVDSASTLLSTAAPASNTPSKFVQGVLRGPTWKGFIVLTPSRTSSEVLRVRSVRLRFNSLGPYSFMHLTMVAVLARFCTASPYLHEEPVPTTTSPDSKTRGTEARSLETLPENQPLINPNPNPSSQMHGTEVWSLETVSENQPLVNPDPDPSSQMHGTEVRSLETVPENQTLEPNLESPSDPITSNESPDVDMVDTTDLQPSTSPAIAGSAGSGAEAIPPRPVPP
ncbi:hypothetical protein PAXINDRAFT_16441 [Paxillus involutus ATCC 200175]|uniref:Uncharacterized protein n=1 Tax=Paxillus involutus ATCC 200175 TaxID=664439 RepID=A0A0C9TTS9_PAXIN|nr:hypothetical protein PAXINDRAFT_16441 [Paxillus involutus ATCC 200175]